MVWQWRSTDAPGKNEQANTNKLKRDQHAGRALEQSVAPLRARSFEAGENVKSREQYRLIEAVKNVVRLNAMPQTHQTKREEIAENSGSMFAAEPLSARRRE